jgi:hypothetical protein
MLKMIFFGMFVLLVVGARAALVQTRLVMCQLTAAAGCVERCTYIEPDVELR